MKDQSEFWRAYQCVQDEARTSTKPSIEAVLTKLLDNAAHLTDVPFEEVEAFIRQTRNTEICREKRHSRIRARCPDEFANEISSGGAEASLAIREIADSLDAEKRTTLFLVATGESYSKLENSTTSAAALRKQVSNIRMKLRKAA